MPLVVRLIIHCWPFSTVLALTNLYQRAAALHVPVLMQDMVTVGALKGASVIGFHTS